MRALLLGLLVAVASLSAGCTAEPPKGPLAPLTDAEKEAIRQHDVEVDAAESDVSTHTKAKS
jgi:hypothetical protein